MKKIYIAATLLSLAILLLIWVPEIPLFLDLFPKDKVYSDAEGVGAVLLFLGLHVVLFLFTLASFIYGCDRLGGKEGRTYLSITLFISNSLVLLYCILYGLFFFGYLEKYILMVRERFI